MSGLNRSQGKATLKLTKLARMASSNDVTDWLGVHLEIQTTSSMEGLQTLLIQGRSLFAGLESQE